MHTVKSHLIFLAICSLLFFSVLSPSLAQERKEQAFFSFSTEQVLRTELFQIAPIRLPFFSVPGMSSIINETALDDVYGRLVVAYDDGGPNLGYVYVQDIADGDVEFYPLLSAELVDTFNALAVHGIRDQIFFVNITDNRQIKKTSFLPGDTPSIFYDGTAPLQLTATEFINAIAVKKGTEEVLFFSAIDSGGSLTEAQIYRVDSGGATRISTFILPADMNSADSLRYNAAEDRLYAFGDNGSNESLIVYRFNTNRDLVAEEEYVFGWGGSNITDFDFLYDSFLGILDKLILSDSSIGAPFDDIFEIDPIPTNYSVSPGALFGNGDTVTSVDVINRCNEFFSVDSDGDGDVDCLDPCPNDNLNLCNALLYVFEDEMAVSPNRRNEFVFHTFNDSTDPTGEGEIAKRVAGFYNEVVTEFVLDQEGGRLYYLVEGSTEIRVIDLENNQKLSPLVNFPSASDGIAHLVMDHFFDELYVVTDEGAQCVVYKVTLSGSAEPLFRRPCQSGPLINGLLVDQRFDIIIGAYFPRLYYSYETFVYEVELFNDSSTIDNVNSHREVTNDQFIANNGLPGSLALDHVNNQLYYYVISDDENAVYRSRIINLDSPQPDPELFVSDTGFSDDHDKVHVHFHPRVKGDSQQGRIFVSDSGFANRGLIAYKDVDASPTAPLLDAKILFNDATDAMDLIDFDVFTSCGPGAIDSDNDTSPDCTGFVDVCPTDPDIDAIEDAIDQDGDGVFDCNDECPTDANKVIDDFCGCFGGFTCDVEDIPDQCDNSDRRFPGICGCDGRPNDVEDTDGDGFPDCIDVCPVDQITNENDEFINIFPTCGCGVEEDLSDPDLDGRPICQEDCLDSATEECGCGITDCSGVIGVLLTNRTRIKEAPAVNNAKSNGKLRKRRFRLNLKAFSGASLLSDSLSEGNVLAMNKKDKKLKVRYRVIIQKLVGDKVRTVKRILSNKAVTRLIKLNNGKYTVRYKAIIKRKKKTESQTNFSPSRNFNIPLL